MTDPLTPTEERALRDSDDARYGYWAQRIFATLDRERAAAAKVLDAIDSGGYIVMAWPEWKMRVNDLRTLNDTKDTANDRTTPARTHPDTTAL